MYENGHFLQNAFRFKNKPENFNLILFQLITSITINFKVFTIPNLGKCQTHRMDIELGVFNNVYL